MAGAPPPPFQRFLEAERDCVWRFLVASVGRADADDCFQETFLAALRAYPEARDENLRSWVFTIAHRKALDHHRARARRATPVADVPEGAAPGVGDADPDLWAQVDELPPKQRAAILHRFRTGMSYAQVAEVIGCSEDAARRSAHEGLKRLRRTYA
jgi:DNA-directed RNA polymerase specialized sigma24 family protein